MSVLDGVRVKLELARSSAAELDTLLRPAIRSARETIFRAPSENPSEVVYRIAKVPWVNPIWGAVLGQGIYNIRSALDHLAWQLVILDGQEPTKKTQFPLHDSQWDENGRRRTLTISPGINRRDIMDAVEAVQPYNAGGTWGSQLGLVAELSRLDKHRLLIAVTTMLNMDNTFWGLPDGVKTPGYDFPIAKALSDGDVVARFIFSGAPAPSEFDPHLEPQIALAEAPEGSLYRTQNLASLLDGLTKIISFQLDEKFVTPFFPDEDPLWVTPQAPPQVPPPRRVPPDAKMPAPVAEGVTAG